VSFKKVYELKLTQEGISAACVVAALQAAFELDMNVDFQNRDFVTRILEILDRWNVPLPDSLLAKMKATGATQ
jgi:hypothetical protein